MTPIVSDLEYLVYRTQPEATNRHPEPYVGYITLEGLKK